MAIKTRSFHQVKSDLAIGAMTVLLYGLLFSVLIFGIYGPAYEASDFIYMNY